MVSDKVTILTQTKQYIQDSKIGRLFLNERFFHYSWIGVVISLLNIFLLWLFIDIFHIGTVVSSTIVIGMTFIIRYVLYDYSKML